MGKHDERYKRVQSPKPTKSKNSIQKQIKRSPGYIFKKIFKAVVSIFLIGVITGTIVFGAFVYYVFNYVDGTLDVDLNNLKLNLTSFIYVKNPETGNFYEYKELHSPAGNRIWVDIKDIPEHVRYAFIAIEDKRFKAHEGVDWRRTFYALSNMIFKFAGSQQGGSTITQQLVKNLTGDAEISPDRKIQEIMRARYLEENYSKDAILECYLNTINLDGRFGIETASLYYFGKNVKDLSVAESAAIAAITKSPTYYNPIKNPENNQRRRKQVLYEMFNQGYITETEYNEAKEEKLKLVGKDTAESTTAEIQNYYIDLVIDDVIEGLMQKYGYTKEFATNMLYSGGLRIYSNLDLKVQAVLDEGYIEKDNLFKELSGDVQPQSAMMIMDYQGNVLGVAGGRGEKTGNRVLNRVKSSRNPGSTIKPLSAYAPAMEYGMISYSSIVNDAPITIKQNNKNVKWPQNYSQTYSGRTSLERAIKISLNTIPAYLIQQMTPKKSYNYLTTRFNLTTLVEKDIDYSPLTVGGMTYGVTVRDMAAAYASFGNLGKYYKPYTYTMVTDAKGNTILEKPNNPTNAMSEETAFIMNKLLQKVVSDSGATGYVARLGKMPVFAKTGTTNDYKDLWFVGGTPYYIGACWYGYDIPERLPAGRDKAPHLAWKAVMEKLNKGLPIKDFPECQTVVSRVYCRNSGKLATSGCSSTGIGWYAADNLPGKCDIHSGSLLANPDDSVTKNTTQPTTQAATKATEPVEPTTKGPVVITTAPVLPPKTTSVPGTTVKFTIPTLPVVNPNQQTTTPGGQ